MNNATTKVAPFLKWAGGKRWFVENHSHFLETDFVRYIEPFLGSGAVFFHLLPQRAILSDANSDLVDTYRALKGDWQKVERNLQRHQRNHSKPYYYRIRVSKPRSAAGRAAKFIYLNRTCWNGLYRVNLRGEFNVPIGTKSNVLLDSDDFPQLSRVLRKARLVACDFEKSLSLAGRGDLVFCDPPYTVKHNSNGFIKYNEGLFSWDDQIRLRDSVVRARDRGAKVIVTNAHTASVRSLYKGVGTMSQLIRSSVISGNSSARGRFEELIVKCF